MALASLNVNYFINYVLERCKTCIAKHFAEKSNGIKHLLNLCINPFAMQPLGPSGLPIYQHHNNYICFNDTECRVSKSKGGSTS